MRARYIWRHIKYSINITLNYYHQPPIYHQNSQESASLILKWRRGIINILNKGRHSRRIFCIAACSSQAKANQWSPPCPFSAPGWLDGNHGLGPKAYSLKSMRDHDENSTGQVFSRNLETAMSSWLRVMTSLKTVCPNCPRPFKPVRQTHSPPWMGIPHFSWPVLYSVLSVPTMNPWIHDSSLPLVFCTWSCS